MTSEHVALDARLIEDVRCRVAPDTNAVRAFVEAAVRRSLDEGSTADTSAHSRLRDRHLSRGTAIEPEAGPET